jgi:hypothetical protein
MRGAAPRERPCHPIFSISTSTRWPGFSQTGGLRAMPTPCGVPVRITLPAGSVVSPLRNSSKVGTSKIICEVSLSCMVVPSSRPRTAMRRGQANSSGVTTQGPSGQNVSKDLARHHCPPERLFCQSRALTSFAQVNPATKSMAFSRVALRQSRASTTASSASASTSSLRRRRGSTMASPGPMTERGLLQKSTGWSGMGAPVSAAWSR